MRTLPNTLQKRNHAVLGLMKVVKSSATCETSLSSSASSRGFEEIR